MEWTAALCKGGQWWRVSDVPRRWWSGWRRSTQLGEDDSMVENLRSFLERGRGAAGGAMGVGGPRPSSTPSSWGSLRQTRAWWEMHTGTVTRGVPIVGGSVPCLHRNQARMAAAMTNSGELLRSNLAAIWVKIWGEIERGSRGFIGLGEWLNEQEINGIKAGRNQHGLGLLARFPDGGWRWQWCGIVGPTNQWGGERRECTGSVRE
jgi:hypothetical protein